MGLNRRNKNSAEFSMASLTDIIFLLLIFFMLTSNFVDTQPFELPKSDSKTVAPTSVIVSISKEGEHRIDNEVVPQESLERALVPKIRVEAENDPNYTITIVAEVGTPFESVLNVMKIAGKFKVKAIIATQPTS
ncbi:MAG: biopolymer transporter ExbD [Haliscomenobacter sp.]|nr:biopolymer transporter ExbD [Haliscomenobacter sp.]MBK8877344.1 biopolymer transporter ExbD [Haliscomenobacter sp.]